MTHQEPLSNAQDRAADQLDHAWCIQEPGTRLTFSEPAPVMLANHRWRECLTTVMMVGNPACRLNGHPVDGQERDAFRLVMMACGYEP